MRKYHNVVAWKVFSGVLAGFAAWMEPASAARKLSIDDLPGLREVSDPQIAPDGAWIAYVVTSTDSAKDVRHSDLWMVGWDGKQQVQLTFDAPSVGTPRWSPDGRYLCFLADRSDKDDSQQLWVLDRRGGEARRLTDLPLNLSDYAWSPDGRRLALVGRNIPKPPLAGDQPRPEPIVIDRYYFKNDRNGYLRSSQATHLYIYDLQAATLARLTSEDTYEETAPAWSPDGSRIAFVSNRNGPQWDRTVNTDVHVIAVQPGAVPRKLTGFEGRDGGPLSWSPDGKRIAYVQGADPQYYIYGGTQGAVVALDGSAPSLLAPALDRDVEQPQFSADGRFIDALVEDDRSVYPARIAGRGGQVQRLLDAPGVVRAHVRARDRTVLLWTDDRTPAELYALEKGGLRRLTNHNAWLQQVQLAATERFSFASQEGTQINGLVTVPGPATGLPAVFWLHGGPYSQHTHDFDFTRQLFAAAGYAVVEINVRGSSGRGSAFARSIYADWGNKDVADVLAGVDHLVARQRIDPQRLAVGGWSYGGVLTNYVIATDTRFKAAISGAGVSNQLSMYGSDQYIFPYEREFGLPWRSAERWVKLSYPFFHAERIRTPTLFLGGDRDFNVPIAGGEQMYQALQSLQVPTQLVIYPGEKHSIVRPSFVRDRLQRYLAWLERYLQPSKLTQSR